MWQVYFARIIGCVITVGFLNALSAQNTERTDWNPSLHSSINFVKNEGQFHPHSSYRLALQQGALYLENRAFTYIFHEALPDIHGGEQGWEKGRMVKQHAFQLSFQGASDGVHIYPSQKKEAYHNYFLGNDPSNWVSRVPLFGRLLYKDLYTGIDMQILGQGDALKYEFIVQEGKNPDVIRMKYKGVDDLFVKDGNLHVVTSLVEIVEMAPFAYQMIGGEQVAVPCHFVVEDDEVTFSFPESYDTSKLLVIDPTLIFSTYSGSLADNWGYTATYDQLGYAYAGGIHYGNFSLNGYPVTLGALQIGFQGGMADITLSKFSPEGNSLLFSTYLGGGQDEYPTSLVVNDQQELFLLGRTNSTNFPVAANAYQPSLNVGPAREAFDLVVMHFSEDGTQLLGSTYLGGAGEDGVNGTVEINEYTATKHNYGDESRGEIIMAPNGDCVFTASSQSNNFPVSSGAAQPAYGGMQDMVVVRMTQDMSTIVSSTYMGGNGEDAGYGIKMKSDGSYVIAGGTGSNNFPATAGGWQSSFNGGSTDGVVSWISQDMRAIWQSTYLGTSAYDQAYFVELDENENVYLAGQSEGSMPIQPAVSSGKTSIYSNPDSRQFILKLSSDLSDMLYATTVGAVGSRVADIVPTAFLIDQCENVYLSGWGGEVNNGQNGPGGYTFNMPLTSDALQSNTDGSDFYLLVLSRDAELLTYGSYFGGRNSDSRGEHVDGGTSRFDASGQIYQAVCAGCGGESTFPSTPTAFSRTNNSSNCNMAVFKMQFDLSGVIANYLPLDENQDPLPDNAGCAPLTVNFDNISTEKSSLSSWLWDFDDSGNTSTVKSPQYTFTQPGIYDVMLILSDPLSCNEADTIIKVIEVYDIPDAAAGNDTTICVGDAITLNGSGTGTPIWTPAGSLSATDVFMPTATPTVETAYVLNITDVNGCTNEDTVSVSIDDLLQVDAGNDTLVCENTSLTLRANATGASLYAWSPALQLIDAAVLQPQVSPLSSSTMFTVVASSAIGCTVTDSIFVEVFSINLNSDTSVCRGDSVQLSSIGNASSWQWSPATGLSNPTIASPVASPDQTTTYQLLAQDASGCQSTQDVEVSVRDLPLVAAGIDQQICGTGTVNLQASGALTYVWTPASSLSAPASALTAASPTVTTTYTVEGRDAFGCEATDDVTVSVAPLPDVQAGPDEILCLGDTTRLSVSGGISFSWTPATSLSSSSIENPLAFPSVTTDFIVTGRNTFGCVGMDTLTVEVVSPPQVSIQGPASICTGQRVTLQASGADSYLWNTGETASAIDVSPFNMTTYWVRGERQGCAGDSAAKTISVFNDFPLADFAATPTSGFIPLAVQFVDNSLGADRVQWLFGDGNSSQDMSPLHTYTRKGDYEAILVAYSPNNCPDTASMLIEVLGPAVFVPTAFTPNGDGNNDEFQLTILGFEEFSISIYSRWGVKVFSSADRNFSWDGIYKGEALPEGAYVYVIEGEHSGGQPYSKGGTLTIIR